MNIQVYKGSVFNLTNADTLVLPVDGSAPGMEGSVAAQFMRRLDVEDFRELFAPPLAFPFQGRCHWSKLGEWDETHFEWVVALGVLSHQPGANHASVLRSALREMFQGAMRGGIGRSFASAVLSLGWRLRPETALEIMLTEARSPGLDGLEWHIATPDAEVYTLAKRLIG